jgi:hypothetical protein
MDSIATNAISPLADDTDTDADVDAPVFVAGVPKLLTPLYDTELPPPPSPNPFRVTVCDVPANAETVDPDAPHKLK